MSREIDARVAREVMGFNAHDGICQPPGEKDMRMVPSYSTDMNAAMEVVEKMRDLGWHLILDSPCPGRALWEAYFDYCDDKNRHHDYNARTPALAICIAALEAVK